MNLAVGVHRKVGCKAYSTSEFAALGTVQRLGQRVIGQRVIGRRRREIVQMCRVRWALSLFAIVAVGMVLVWSATTGVRADTAEAAGPRFDIAVFADSRSDLCYGTGYFEAIQRLTGLMETEINQTGIHERLIRLHLYDGKRNPDTTIKQIRAALGKKQLLAMIGLSSSTRAKKVFDSVGDEIAKSGVPFISHISVSEIFKTYPTVFSTRPTQEVERAPIMARFIRAYGIKSVAFLGRKGVAFIDAVRAGLRAELGQDGTIVSDNMIALKGDPFYGTLDKDELEAAIAEIKQRRPSMLVLAVGSRLSNAVIPRLIAQQVTPQIFLVGRIGGLTEQLRTSYPNAIYETAWGRVPEVVSDRALAVLRGQASENWRFAGRKVAAADGWSADGYCSELPVPDVELMSEENLRAIRHGAQHADMMKLIATSAATARKSAIIKPYRKAVLDALTKTYVSGVGAFKGRFENWSFHAGSRARAQTPFVVILPQKLGQRQLSPKQFIRLRDHGSDNKGDGQRRDIYREIETIYVDVDLIRLYGVDNNAKSFYADFYLAMRRSHNLTIKDIAFTNAFIDPSMIGIGNSNGRQIIVEQLNSDDGNDAYPRDMRMYKVSGRFRFTPDFRNYPFDTQRFSIDLQPKRGDKPFIVQPPPAALRDRHANSEGWQPDRQYVSYVEDFVPVIDAFTHKPSIAPFFNMRFVWQMTRETTDYYIRVIVPLLFILSVAYLSIFIPQTHLEAIVTIQVTALLSAVALYLSLPQIDTDKATISDRIFMFDYMMVSIMIMISILRINTRVGQRQWLSGLLSFTHIVLLPTLLMILVVYVASAELLKAFNDSPLWALMGFVTGQG